MCPPNAENLLHTKEKKKEVGGDKEVRSMEKLCGHID